MNDGFPLSQHVVRRYINNWNHLEEKQKSPGQFKIEQNDAYISHKTESFICPNIFRQAQ